MTTPVAHRPVAHRRNGTLPYADGPAVYVLHENEDWWPPFAAAFDRAGVPVVPWLLVEGSFDLVVPPPADVVWSRISASSHTRGHGLSKDYARSVLSWLEAGGTRVLNGRRAIEIEVSKVHQLSRLAAHGIDVPRTQAVVGHDHDALVAAARGIGVPFVLKHNQGGKGVSVERFDTADELAERLRSAPLDLAVDGVTLVQEYLRPVAGFITRAEFVGGDYLYALKADTVHGGFQLCPADACALDPATGRPLLPPGAEIAPEPGQDIFDWREDFDDPGFVARLAAFLDAEGVDIAGVEFIETDDGRRVVYDVNTNTNYNPVVEAKVAAAGHLGGPDAIARLLGSLLPLP